MARADGRVALARARRSRPAPALRPGAARAARPEDQAGDDPIANRGDRYVPEPPGTVKKMRFWYGPYAMPAGWDANRVDLDLPVHDGMIIAVEPELRISPDWKEPSHQVAHIHHAHWFAARPGQRGGQLHRRQHRVDLRQRRRGDAAPTSRSASAADPKGPIYGEYIGAGRAAGDDLHAPQQDRAEHGRLRRARRHLQVRHARAAQRAPGREHHDVAGVLFGRTFDVPREPKGDGRDVRDSARTTSAGRSSGPSTIDGTMIGTGVARASRAG